MLASKALSTSLLAAARRPALRRVVTGTPATRRVVDRFVAGETAPEAVLATEKLVSNGLNVTLDHLGEDVTDLAAATATAEAYLDVLKQLAAAGLTKNA